MKTSNKILSFLFLLPFLIGAQNDVYTITKVMPEFPGGVNELANYIKENVKYPSEAREMNYSGKVYVTFIVDTTGQILQPGVLKSSGHKCLDDEALRVIAAMPKWSPGSDSINKVKVSINVPVTFKNLGTLSAPPGQVKLSPEQQQKHDRAMICYNRGHKFEQDKDYRSALEQFDRSLSYEPQNKYALFDKAKMHLNLGDKAKACEIWRSMVSLNLRKEESEDFIKKNCN